jgi:hypothetical protein
MNERIQGRLVAVIAALLGACATGGGMYSQPYALFEALQRSPVEDTRPAFVLDIDGRNVRMGADDPVTPGMHTVKVSIPDPAGLGQPASDTLQVDAKPCTRYYFAAQRSSRTARDWKAFVAGSEPIGECVKRFS